MRIHREYYAKKLSLCVAVGRFDEGVEALEKQQKEIKKFGKKEFQTSRFYYQYFYLYFGTGDYDKAPEVPQRVAQPAAQHGTGRPAKPGPGFSI